jgi:hypothetical protein
MDPALMLTGFPTPWTVCETPANSLLRTQAVGPSKLLLVGRRGAGVSHTGRGEVFGGEICQDAECYGAAPRRMARHVAISALTLPRQPSQQPPHLRVIPTTGPGYGRNAAFVEGSGDAPQRRYGARSATLRSARARRASLKEWRAAGVKSAFVMTVPA